MELAAIGALVALGSAALAVAVSLLAARLLPERWLSGSADIAGALYSSVGMAFAILISLGAIAVWEPHSEASASTDREAGALAEAHWAARNLPPAERAVVRAKIREYATVVVHQEWPELAAHQRPSPRAAELLIELRTTADQSPESAARQQVAHQLTEVAGARRARIGTAGATMPAVLWPALIAGAVINAGFLLFAGLRPTVPHLAMLGTAAAMTGVLLFILYQLELPFGRAFAVTPEAFEALLSAISASSA
ncbi:DUF4239 domain-containing protein [Longispora albida]|uniref:bestrophin-like domain n=1 Tax=Longispora albida TaxID=203523 RepID=UPI000366EFB5|nr:DUF4239 domain-containing protein [Longispora albida]